MKKERRKSNERLKILIEAKNEKEENRKRKKEKWIKENQRKSNGYKK